MSDLMNDKNYIEELRQQIQWLQKTLLQRDQQLAQARKENEKLIQRLAEMSQIPQSQRHALQQENAAMRALLRRCLSSHRKPSDGFFLDIAEPVEAVLDDMRAFLAQHKEGIPDDS